MDDHTRDALRMRLKPAEPESSKEEGENSGLSVDYYKIPITNPTTKHVTPYIAECNDIIEALEMSYAEGNVFKATWRKCAARLGLQKKGNDGIRDAEKIVFFGDRIWETENAKQNN